MTPEAKVKKAVDKLLKTYGDDVYRFMPVQSRWGTRTLDFLGCHRGRFFAIETKAPGATPTKFQLLVIDDMLAAGARVFVIDDDLTLLKKWLDDAYQPAV